MRNVALIGIAGFLLIAIPISSGLAGVNSIAKVAVHVMPHLDGRTCSNHMPSFLSGCDVSYVYVGCDAVDVFPVFYDLVEYLGCEYGLTWPGEATCAFTSCSDLWIGNITHPGDGISQVWLGCRMGCAVPGFARIESTGPGQICVVPHPIGGRVLVLDCHESVNEPMWCACAGVCDEPGDDPCGELGTLWISETEDACADCVGHGDTLSYTLSYDNTHWCPVDDISVIDYLSSETEYVSSMPAGTYDAGSHTVTWFIGEMAGWSDDGVVLRARLKPDAPAAGTVRNRCKIYQGVTPIHAASDSTPICSSSTTPTTWGKIKGMFR
jgi:uncharacterized repeat protein (TIGR01451 family)